MEVIGFFYFTKAFLILLLSEFEKLFTQNNYLLLQILNINYLA